MRPGWDVNATARVRGSFPRICLMVDGNSAYSHSDFRLLQQLEAYSLMMIEQPWGWDDLYGHVELQKLLQTPLCLDECIHAEEQARAALALGACRIINVKLGRVGGYTVARRIHDLCQHHQVPVWCGGMLESGHARAPNNAPPPLPHFFPPPCVFSS